MENGRATRDRSMSFVNKLSSASLDYQKYDVLFNAKIKTKSLLLTAQRHTYRN